ncbi:hypothetical protein AGABI1DRAFT_67833 [Agaricus bisporus var. burnettii JB137-S8]|uniref:BTB domain-containing protein n=1 Tax=Agaricus bisporus var. burnettii (strain JB137-S8 / ATCC MYA-4627 / FGSC 10392) TaxID=597362 RepID=K5WC02_AGABU|nr:uncharacterized protein AGABI1DRAFT_67833 [Agaricus bisporus var. burnettii JB137-S8]EKM84429.1 hypothetical protein AGABI1DRAFT_67833 [Agaricus bisporus var. burnettii JB137-S8]
MDSYTRHPKFYFNDGSIILDVERTHFRVHQSLLNRQSELFESMFSLKQPENATRVDGCLLVELAGDSVSDMEEFFCTVYDPFYFDRLECTSDVDTLIKFISGILRISAKYEMTMIKRKCVSVLLEKFPITLAGCDRIMKSEYRYKTNAIVDAINLAHTANVPEILPWAYYISTHVSVKDLLHDPNLSWKDKALCLAGKERLWHAQKTRTHAFLFDELQSEECSVGCDGRPSVMAWSDSERLRMNPHPLEEYKKWSDLNICMNCQRDFQRRHKEARVWLWETLPELFELGTWNGLRSDL